MYGLSTLISCASLKTPEGGPKDKNAPKVLKEYPKNCSTNFSNNKIEISFDEYVDLQNEMKEISISPATKKGLEFRIKQKSLTILIKDTLEKNTTYKISFGKAIVDVTEKNILKNYNYVFSTGKTIDSLKIVGKVINNYTQKPEIDILVILHPENRDTLFTKKSAVLFCSTDSFGRFAISNLRNIPFKIFALRDLNNNKFYDGVEEIGFLGNSIIPKNEVKDSVILSSFKEEISKRKITKKSILRNGSIKVGFNKPLEKFEVVLIEPKDDTKYKLFEDTNIEKDSLEIFVKNIQELDSLKICIKTENNTLDTLIFKRSKSEKVKGEISFTDNLISGNIKPGNTYKFKTNIPIIEFYKEKLSLYLDSIEIKKYNINQIDAQNFELIYNFDSEKYYKLKIMDSAFVGLNKIYNKSKEVKMRYDVAENYGNIVLKVSKVNISKNYILEIVDLKILNKILYSFPIDEKEKNININLIPTGKYLIRLILDENANKKLDTGSLEKQKQPEKIRYKEKAILVKANWDIEEKVIIEDF